MLYNMLLIQYLYVTICYTTYATHNIKLKAIKKRGCCYVAIRLLKKNAKKLCYTAAGAMISDIVSRPVQTRRGRRCKYSHLKFPTLENDIPSPGRGQHHRRVATIASEPVTRMAAQLEIQD